MQVVSWLILELREAPWLHPTRARAWCSVLAIMIAMFVIGTLARSDGGTDGSGKPLGTDFFCFWTASHLALEGHAAFVYQPVLHQAAQHALFPQLPPAYLAFFYPPTFLLLCLPLALLPYLPSLAIWLIAGLSVLFAGLRRLLPQGWAIVPTLAFPAVLDNLAHGWLLGVGLAHRAMWRSANQRIDSVGRAAKDIRKEAPLRRPFQVAGQTNSQKPTTGICGPHMPGRSDQTDREHGHGVV
jgi:hypothetical protein